MGRTLLYGFIGVLFAVVQWQKCAQREQECVSIMLFGLRPSQPKCHMHRAAKTDFRDRWDTKLPRNRHRGQLQCGTSLFWAWQIIHDSRLSEMGTPHLVQCFDDGPHIGYSPRLPAARSARMRAFASSAMGF